MSEIKFPELKIDMDFRKFTTAMGHAANAAHRAGLALMQPGARRRHRRRCAICAPFANPKSLAFDGRQYHRRSKRR